MPLKSHEENVENTIKNLLSMRARGLTIELSTRERERAIEDLKILLSYFVGTGLCYIAKTVIANVGGEFKHLNNVLVLKHGKIEHIRRLIGKRFETFDFSKYDLNTEFQKAKREWLEYYGSIPASWKEKRIENDHPLMLPPVEAIERAISDIQDVLLIDKTTINEIINNLVSGKNVIIAGPIGTGKTHLARLIPQLVWKFDGGYYPEVVTATADWTTTEVIGGLFPKVDENGNVKYVVQRGCVYDTVVRNLKINGLRFLRQKVWYQGNEYKGVWLIIDEFNRANIDRAFGEMFTAIEYGILKVPTSKEREYFEEIPIPQDYRIIGTLNTFDKHYLFRLSDALKRRFAFVELFPPERDKAEKEKYYVLKRSFDELTHKSSISDAVILDHESKRIVREESDSNFVSLLDSAYEIMSFIRYTKNLGTAILISMFKFILIDNITNHDLENSLDIALRSNVIPQLENVSRWSLEAIKAFACENIVALFRQASPDSVDFSKYEEEFAKLLRYLGKDKIQKKVERYRKGLIGDEEWKGYDPWAGKTRPKLPLFRRSLFELIEESRLI
jgi:MoxR-like ATPase